MHLDLLQTWTLSLLIRRLAVTPLITAFLHACAFHAKVKHNADSLPSSGPAGPFQAGLHIQSSSVESVLSEPADCDLVLRVSEV